MLILARAGGNHILGRIAHLDLGRFKVGGLKLGVAVVQPPRLEPGEERDQGRNGIGGAMGIGDMALLAFDLYPDIDAAPASDLDHVAQFRRRGWLADETVIDTLAFFFQKLDHGARAVHGLAFLVARDQEGQGARHLPLGQNLRTGADPGGDGAFHVHRAPAPDHVFGDFRAKGIPGPGRRIAHRHDIRVTGETEVGAARPQPGVQIFNFAELQTATGKAQRRKRSLDRVHRPGVPGRDGGGADQVSRQGDRVNQAFRRHDRAIGYGCAL